MKSALLALFITFFVLNGVAQELDKESDLIAQYSKQIKEKFLQQFLDSNPFALMSESQVRDILRSRMEGNGMGDLLKSQPKFENFFVGFIRSSDAFPSLIRMLDKPKKLKLCMAVSLGCFLLNFILGLIIGRNDRFFKRLFKKLILSSGLMFISTAFVFYTFKAELNPTILLVQRHLL